MRRIIYIFSILAFTSCSLAPDYMRPALDTPAWKGSDAATDNLQRNWWALFKSNELTSLIDEAKKNNTDLRAGIQRIEQARAQLTIARSGLFPQLNANADLALTDSHGSSSKTYGGGVTMAYEADLWRRNGNTAQAAGNRLMAARYDQDALDLMITSETAQRYFEILALKERLRINNEIIVAFKNTLNIIDTRYKEGAASGLELSQQKIVFANTQAAINGIQRDATITENALAVLLGKPPQIQDDTFKRRLQDLKIPKIAPLQPASLLERRPDIRSLEEDLKAANADIGVARAAIFPSLNIAGNLNTIGNPTFNSFNLGTGIVGSLAMSIFNGGQLQAQVDRTTAVQKELVENYRTAVLVAFRETEDSLATVKAAQSREEKFNLALAEANTAYEIANQRYLDGADDFLTLLDAQRSLLQTKESYVQARLDRLTAALSLFRALGGGWQG